LGFTQAQLTGSDVSFQYDTGLFCLLQHPYSYHTCIFYSLPVSCNRVPATEYYSVLKPVWNLSMDEANHHLPASYGGSQTLDAG
jgi:hypothetical protein